MGGNDSACSPMAKFGIRGVEPSYFTTRDLVINERNCITMTNIKMHLWFLGLFSNSSSISIINDTSERKLGRSWSF